MKHAFVICAYKDSPYLVECIKSIKNQTIDSEVILATSTPSSYIEEMCRRYGIPLKVRNGQPNIASDWNFAMAVSHAQYITIAHQDDLYYPDYAKQVVEMMERSENPLIAFADYAEYKNGIECAEERNLKIKRMLLAPMKNITRSSSRFWKRFIIRFGNAISCPTVTYHKAAIWQYLKQEQRRNLFRKHFRSNLDWQAWEWLSRKTGQFLYLPEVLMAHRIHEDSETTATIEEHQRGQEDYEMFCKFWPKPFARVMAKWYGKSEEGNKL